VGKYKVIAPTNVMPVTPGPVYGEGKEFELDERDKENARYVEAQLKAEVIAPVKEKEKPKEKK